MNTNEQATWQGRIRPMRSGLPMLPVGAEARRGTPVIATGLSVICAGHLLELERDTKRRVASVRVYELAPDDKRRKDDELRPELNGKDWDGDRLNTVLTDAADMLADRAQRFLGGAWAVVRWAGSIQ